MTKEKYIELRKENALGEIVYSFYKEKAKEKGLKIYDSDFFIKAFNIWANINRGAVKTATSYYDNKFTVQTTMFNNKEINYI